MVATGSTWDHQIARVGFSLIPEVFERREITSLLRGLGNLDDRRGRAGVRHILGHPRVKAIANDARMLGIAQAVLGETVLPFRATLFDKSPDSNWLIAWHQDTALPLTEKREAYGWGPWSVKEGINYAHAPASALEQVLALRSIWTIRPTKTDRCGFCQVRTTWGFLPMPRLKSGQAKQDRLTA